MQLQNPLCTLAALLPSMGFLVDSAESLRYDDMTGCEASTRPGVPRMTEPSSNTDDREVLCRRCGRCCYAKIVIDGEIVYLPFPCPYLDEDTRLCTIYERRHEVNPDCLTLEEGIRIGVFPADCPYVAGIEGYKPPREKWTRRDIEAYYDEDSG